MMPRRAAGCALVALLAVALAAGAAADDDDDHAQAALDAGEAFDPRKAMTEFLEYQASHPEFAAGVATWVTVGILLFGIGSVILIWSEAHAMLGLSNLSAPPDTPRRGHARRAVRCHGRASCRGGHPHDDDCSFSAAVQWCGTKTSGRGWCCRSTSRRAQISTSLRRRRAPACTCGHTCRSRACCSSSWA